MRSNQFKGSQSSHLLQKLCNQTDTHSQKIVNNLPYRDRGLTADPSGEVKKMKYTDKEQTLIQKSNAL